MKFIKKISSEKRKQNINEIYWGKPVSGFGDNIAKIVDGLTKIGKLNTN